MATETCIDGESSIPLVEGTMLVTKGIEGRENMVGPMCCPGATCPDNAVDMGPTKWTLILAVVFRDEGAVERANEVCPSVPA